MLQDHNLQQRIQTSADNAYLSMCLFRFEIVLQVDNLFVLFQNLLHESPDRTKALSSPVSSFVIACPLRQNCGERGTLSHSCRASHYLH